MMICDWQYPLSNGIVQYGENGDLQIFFSYFHILQRGGYDVISEKLYFLFEFGIEYLNDFAALSWNLIR